jgi:hypothetical protein
LPTAADRTTALLAVAAISLPVERVTTTAPEQVTPIVRMMALPADTATLAAPLMPSVRLADLSSKTEPLQDAATRLPIPAVFVTALLTGTANSLPTDLISVIVPEHATPIVWRKTLIADTAALLWAATAML